MLFRSDMEVCCTLGMITENQAQRLAEAGLYAYNHNLDSSEEYYKEVISTRGYQDRLDTIGNVRKTNVTVCFSATQALIAAKAGATYISPFVGRLDDIGHYGMDLIQQIRTIYDNYGFETEILAASVRTTNHVSECAMIGADVVTAPPAVIKSLANHPLTDKGLAAFLADIADTGQKIL